MLANDCMKRVGFCMCPYRKILELYADGVSLSSIAMITQHSWQKVTEIIH